MLTSQQVSTIVPQYWANRFEFDVKEFTKPGTIIRPEASLDENNRCILYNFDQLSCLRISEKLAVQIGLQAGKLEGQFLSKEALIEKCAPYAEIEYNSTLMDHFLNPDDFQPKPIPEPFTLRQLDGEKDAALLTAYYATCTEAELDEADIDFDEPDPIIFGLFDDDQMAAYASHRYWDDILADIGVLIHPHYRSRGLGKAVVSVITDWCLNNDIVPMYRVFSYHQQSIKIAQSLGFKLFVSIDSLKSNQA
jgi:GNAT superfamily N-acetyltransferase